MDQENIKHTHTHTHTHKHTERERRKSLLSIKKERNPVICNNINDPGGHYAKWNKPNEERQILNDLIYIRNLKKLNSQKQRIEEWLLGYRKVGGNGERY